MKKFYSLLAVAALLCGLSAGPGFADDDEHSHGSDDSRNGQTAGNNARDVVVMATNDLGMHCVCMGFDNFVLLPPFNTLRAQVIQRGEEPRVLDNPSDIRVEYNIVENTDDTLKNDPYFQSWLTNAPKLFPGFQPVDPSDGKIQGLTGAKLNGEMQARSGEGWWEIAGVPAYPDASSLSTGAQKIMIDPLGGPNRNPYLTGNVKVFDQATGALLAETNTVVPVAFGGCCGCHLDVAEAYGRTNPTPRDSFEIMGMLHSQNSSGIDISKIDPDGDGVGGPIRCSQCHLDPAMGESTPPGYAGYPVSKFTFSDVVHRWHATSTEVLTNYDPNIATDCYQCHPGNNVNCYRGHHVTKSINDHPVWCTDCHGDLNQRIAEGQLLDPWSDKTLPKCSDCHDDNGEGGGYLNLGIFGAYLNSRGHEDHKILCSTCHGAPHALYPSTLAADNAQNIALQGRPDAIGVCSVCHTDKNNEYHDPH